MKKLITTITTCLVLAVLAFGAAAADKALLDGQRFKGTITETGKGAGDPEVLSFQGGMLHSSACDQYGFKPAPYTARQDGKVIRFESIAKNEAGATNTWTGTVDGDRVEAKLVWSDGKSTSRYEARGQRMR